MFDTKNLNSVTAIVDRLFGVRDSSKFKVPIHLYPPSWDGTLNTTNVNTDSSDNNGSYEAMCSYINEAGIMNAYLAFRNQVTDSAIICPPDTFQRSTGKYMDTKYVTNVGETSILGPWLQLTYETQDFFLDKFAITVGNKDSLFQDFVVVGSNDNGETFDFIYKNENPIQLPNGNFEKDVWYLDNNLYILQYVIPATFHQWYKTIRLIVTKSYPNLSGEIGITSLQLIGTKNNTKLLDLLATTESGPGYCILPGGLTLEYDYNSGDILNPAGLVEVEFRFTYKLIYTVICTRYGAGGASGTNRDGDQLKIVTTSGYTYDPDLGDAVKKPFHWIAFGYREN